MEILKAKIIPRVKNLLNGLNIRLYTAEEEIKELKQWIDHREVRDNKNGLIKV